MHPETLQPVAVVPIAKHLTSADGTAVYAEAIGSPMNPHVVFMHGLSLSSVVWDCIFHDTRYSDQFYLVRYDLRGHGRSGKPKSAEGYASEKFAQDFAAVLETYNLQRPVFVGWSMGATVVTDIVAHLPPRTLSGAVWIAPLPYLGDILPRILTEYIRELTPSTLRNDDVGLFAATKAIFLDSLFSRPDQVSYELKSLWTGASVATTPADMILSCSRTQDPEALLRVAREGAVPLLLLQGSADRHLDANKLVQEVKPLWKDAEVVVFEGLGHALFYENVDGVMERLRNFVARVYPSKV